MNASNTRRYPGVFLGPVSQLAPGSLPLVKIRIPVYHAFIVGIILAWVGMVVGFFSGSVEVGLFSLLLFAACYISVWTIGVWVLPASVEFRGLKTFRDISKAIVGSARG